MALEVGVVVEKEGQRVIDLHRREVFADTLVGKTEELRELAGGRFLVAGRDDGVIPPLLSFDLWDPRVGAERLDASHLVPQSVPRVAGGPDDGLVVGVQAVGEEALLEVEPHALDRVELGRVGRQRLQRDVVGYAQIARAVPAGAIEHHDHVVVFADGGGEAVEELLHRLGVGVRHDEGEAVVGAGLDCREDVGEGEALVAQPRRALTAPPPDVDRAPLLADARLVLEEQANALVLMRVLSFFEQRRGSF